MSTAEDLLAAYHRLDREISRLIRGRSKEFWVAIGLLILYSYLIVMPFVAIFWASFTASGRSLVHGFTLDNWFRMAQVSQTVLFNTVVYAFGTATLTTIMGVCVAWVIARTNTPFGKLFYFVAFLGFFFPPVAWEVAWIRLLGRNGLYATLLGLETLHVGTLPGMIFVGSIRFLSLALILLIPLFSSMDKTLEDAGRIAGNGILRVTKDITIPLLAPGVLAVYLLVLLISFGDFRVPLLLGVPNGIHVLSTAIYEAAQVQPVNYGLAMTQAAVLVFISIPFLFLYRTMLGETGQYGTISGRGYDKSPVDVGGWRYPLAAGVGVFLFITMVIPALVMLYGSLLPFWVPPQHVTFEMFSLVAYENVIENERLLRAVFNSFVIALATTILLIVGATISSWIVQKTDVPFRNLIDYLSFMMIGLPSIALAVGLIYVYLAFVPGGRWIHGTALILVIAFYTRFIPATVKIIEPSVVQITSELLEAGKIAGDSITTRLRKLVIPLIKGSVVAAFSLRFAIVFLELPIAIMLHSRSTEMAAVVLLRLQTTGQSAEIMALGVLVMVLLTAFIGLVHWILD